MSSKLYKHKLNTYVVNFISISNTSSLLMSNMLQFCRLIIERDDHFFLLLFFNFLFINVVVWVSLITRTSTNFTDYKVNDHITF